MNIDIHCHICVPGYVDALRRKGNIYGGQIVTNDQGIDTFVSSLGLRDRVHLA